MATGAAGLLLLFLLLITWGAIAAHRVLTNAPEYSCIALLFVQHAVAVSLSGSVDSNGASWISLSTPSGIHHFLTATKTTRRTAVRPWHFTPECWIRKEAITLNRRGRVLWYACTGELTDTPEPRCAAECSAPHPHSGMRVPPRPC